MALTDNWILGLRFNNNSNDASGTGNNGTVYGAVYDGTTKKVGSHSLFNDGTDDWTDCGNNASFDVSAISIHLWFYSSNVAQAAKHLISKGNAEPWTIQFKTETDKIRFWVKNTSAQYQYAEFATSLLTANTWHEIIATWDGTNIKLFLDGVLRGITAFAGTLAITTNNVNIARESGGTGYCLGYSDEVDVWGRAVTDGGVTTVGNTAGGEVAELWNNGAGIEVGAAGVIGQILHGKTLKSLAMGRLVI